MTFVVLFLLAVVWAIYLASWLRTRTSQRNVNSISSFNRHLSVLERTSPAGPRADRASVTPLYPAAPMRRTGMSLGEARRRRRDVLFALGGAALVTLLGAVSFGGLFVWLHLLVDVALVAYVALLVRAQQLAQERRTKVHYLATPGVAADAGYYLSRSASAR